MPQPSLGLQPPRGPLPASGSVGTSAPGDGTWDAYWDADCDEAAFVAALDEIDAAQPPQQAAQPLQQAARPPQRRTVAHDSPPPAYGTRSSELASSKCCAAVLQQLVG